MRKLTVLLLLAFAPFSLAGAGKPATDPISGEKTEAKGKDDRTEGEKKEEAAPAPVQPVKVDPKLFDEALQDYFNGSPKTAAPKLFLFTENVAQTDENYAWAQYFLARCLLDLGLRHAGAVYLARIARERSNPNVVPRALEELKALTEVPHDERMVDEQIFGSIDLGFLPEDIAGFAHYQQGLIDLKVGNERWAQTHFAKLAEGSVEASHAKFALLVTRLKTNKKEAPKEMIEQFLELSGDQKLTQEARNDAMLAVARLRYEQKDYEGALEAYGKVVLPPLAPGRASLYLEEAWTRYQMGQIHAAMGILTTLDAPSFRDQFLPDKYLLKSMIFRDLCHYLPAKRAAKELTRRYADSLESIHEREDLTKDIRLRRAAISRGGTRRAERFLDSLNLEAERLGRFAGSFGDRLYAYLTKLYDLAHAEAVRVFDERLRESVRLEADRLLKSAEQVRLMEYEVGLKLYERVKKGSKLQQIIQEDKLTPTQVAFRFNGEYWNDELRSYRFSLKSRCIDEPGVQ